MLRKVTLLLVFALSTALLGTPANSGESSINLSGAVGHPWYIVVPNLEFNADGGMVTYQLEGSMGVGENLFVVPLDGSTPPVQINGPLVADGTVKFWTISPDGTRVVYVADEEQDEVFELYTALSDGSAPPTKIPSSACSIDENLCTTVADCPDIGSCASGGDPCETSFDCSGMLNFCVFRAQSCDHDTVNVNITPDGAWIMFSRFPFEPPAEFAMYLYGVPIDASAPPRRLSGPELTFFGGSQITGDSARVVYVDQTGPHGLYSVPIDGSEPPTLLASASDINGNIDITPDGATVVYAADHEVPGRLDVYSIPTDGSAPPFKLTESMAGSGAGGAFITADGTRVYYPADQDTAGLEEFYCVPLDGSEPPTKLSHPLGEDERIWFWGPSDGDWLAYNTSLDGGTFTVFATPIDGSGEALQLASPTGKAVAVRGNWVFYAVNGSGYTVAADGTRPPLPVPGDNPWELPEYGNSLLGLSIDEGAYAVPIALNFPPFRLNGEQTPSLSSPRMDPTETWGVYVATVQGGEALFSRRIDTDGDGTPDETDNCPHGANPGQGAVVFGQQLVASSKTVFSWAVAADVRWVRGPLESVSAYVTDAGGSLADAVLLADTTEPAPGAALYYLVKHGGECAVASWQSSPGAEPERDVILVWTSSKWK